MYAHHTKYYEKRCIEQRDLHNSIHRTRILKGTKCLNLGCARMRTRDTSDITVVLDSPLSRRILKNFLTELKSLTVGRNG